jgi:hypothetical protein
MKPTILLTILLLTGCVNKVYDREFFKFDPNGAITYERIHGGITGVATDTSFDSLIVETKTRKVKITKAEENQDSFKAIVPAVGAIETNE